MSEDSNTSLLRGAIAGAIGGLAASWVMNVFLEKARPSVTHVAQHLDGTAHQPQPSEPSDDSEPKIDATMKTADAVVSTITGGRHLSLEGKQHGGPIVHYAFGALMGAV